MNAYARAAHKVALFFLCLFPAACREGNTMPETPEPITFSLSFSPGDTFRYEAVLIDEYGYYVPSSLNKALQRILSTDGTLAGMSGVITVRDSTTLLRDTTAVEQDFSLAQSADGDLYRHGFLTEIARILKLPMPPDTWDCMAAFSEGFGSSWLVGYLDAAQQKPVYGSFEGVSQLTTANVNGVQTVFSCYRVYMYGEGLSYSFWVSDAPTAFLRYVLEPTETTKGAEFALTDMQVHVR